MCSVVIFLKQTPPIAADPCLRKTESSHLWVKCLPRTSEVTRQREERLPVLLRRGGGDKSPLSDVMTSPVIAVSPQLPISELAPMLSSQGLHCLPVVDEEKLVGMVTQTDLIAALQRSMVLGA